MATTRHQEIERKYDVAPSTIFPNLVNEATGFTVGQPVEHHLKAVYFDTLGLDLSRRGVTLRRRTGGDDAGWHLKVPGGRDSRIEMRRPLGDNSDQPPSVLLDPVRAVVRDRPLVPVARVSTRRREYPLLGPEHVVLAHVCDDEVDAECLVEGREATRWREWEVELADGDRSVLDEVEPRLLDAGAAPAAIGSKLARVLGDSVPAPGDAASGEDLAIGSAADLVRSLLTEQAQKLQERDAGFRAERSDSIHKLRIAARRLRSTLTTYRPLFDPDAMGGLQDQLRWLGQELAPCRDAQVLREHLNAVLADEPAPEVLARLLARDAKRVRRAVREVKAADGAHERDLALHEARKKAKRLRYAAESAIPVFEDRAKDYAKGVKGLQKTLGVRQDSVVARQALREYGVSAHLAGENAFTFGRLHALEQARADQAERAFRKAWKALPHTKVRDWFRA